MERPRRRGVSALRWRISAARPAGRSHVGAAHRPVRAALRRSGTFDPKVLYQKIGGIAPWPIWEDADLVLRIGRRRLVSLRPPRRQYRASAKGALRGLAG